MTDNCLARPPWLVQRVRAGGTSSTVIQLLRELNLNTVCESAHCPNMGECFHDGTATFLILGAVCTRKCVFCAVPKGIPSSIDPTEPERIAQAVSSLPIDHVVITSVTRDDLPDGGAQHFASCVSTIRERNPCVSIELLVPDFYGDSHALDIILAAAPTVLNHNIETVPRLYETIRPASHYLRSLSLLRSAARRGLMVKSGLMVGLGETAAEVTQVLSDLRHAGVSIVTVGQYLRPSPGHIPVASYVTPAQFQSYADIGYALGLKKVIAGPLVRSSYHAGRALREMS